jgi:hypothetical protein
MTTGQIPVDKTNLRNSILRDTNIVRSTFTTTLFSHISACLNDLNEYIGDDLYQYGLDPDKRYPNALSVLAWGNEIILASRQRGTNSYTYEGPTSQVSLSLERCQATHLRRHRDTTATRHRREGKCGEQMAAHLYYRSPTTGETSLRDQNARIGTVVYRASDGVVYQAPPSGNNNDVSQDISICHFSMLMLTNTEG